MSKRELVIRGGRLLDVNRHEAPHADILVVDDTIVQIGKPGLAAPDDAEMIDASRMLLHPGLVNAHTHGHNNLSKSEGDRWTLELLLAASPYLSNFRSPEDKHLTTLIGAAEMVLKGCTACYDLFMDLPTPSIDGISAVAAAYTTVGMRAVIAPMLADLTLYQAVPGLEGALSKELQQAVQQFVPPPWERTIKDMRSLLLAWRGDEEQVRLALAPTIPLHCQDPFLVACKDLAEEFDLGIHSHVAESKIQAVSGQRRYGRSIVEHLHALGLVTRRFTAAHAVWLGRDDMLRMRDGGASVAHNPGSNMRLGSGMADFRMLLELGVNVGIGTDGATCSDSLNMYHAMQSAALSNRVQSPDPAHWISTERIFEAATIGSAQTLGFAKIGSIAPGFKADIVFASLDAISLVPLNDATNQLVLAEDSTSVHSVMIGGSFVVKDRQLLTVDLPRLADQATAARSELDITGAERRALFEQVRPVLSDFCPALARVPWHVNRYCCS